MKKTLPNGRGSERRRHSGGFRSRARQQAVFVLFALSVVLNAAAPDWLSRVAPVMTTAEKSAYLALRPEARARFEADFWADKAISAEEYFKRVAYIDSTFGSNRPGSGAN